MMSCRRHSLTATLAALSIGLAGAPAFAGEPGGVAAPHHHAVRYHLDFDQVELTEVVKAVAQWTGKNFILPDSVRGKITIVGPTEVTADEAYDALLVALDTNGLAVVKSGRFYRILPKQDARRSSVPTDLSGQ